MQIPLNTPNLLTLTRIALIPVFVILYYLPVAWSATATTVIFILAAITDWLDGYLARRWQLISPFGAFLDPVADKLMVVVALVLVIQTNPVIWVTVPVLVIIGREIAISALREWMAILGARAQVAVSQTGKIKTTAQITAIIFLLYQHDIGSIPIYTIGLVLLYTAVILTLWSMLIYLKAAWPQINQATPKQ